MEGNADPLESQIPAESAEQKVRHRKKEKKAQKPPKKPVEPVYGETDPSGTDDQSESEAEPEAPVEPHPAAAKKLKCRRCKAANPPDAKICLRCRNLLVKICAKCQVELPPYYFEEMCENCAVVEKYRQIGLKIGGVLILIGLFLNLMCRMPGSGSQGGSNVNMEDFMKMHRGGH